MKKKLTMFVLIWLNFPEDFSKFEISSMREGSLKYGSMNFSRGNFGGDNDVFNFIG